MKTLPRPVLVVILAVLLAASASSPSDAARRMAPLATTYDGLWSVLITTRYGDCDPAYRYAVRIASGRVVNSDEGQDHQAYGAVGRSGAIRVIVVRGGQRADGIGRLSRNYGRGRWRTSTGQCGGVWTAVRRGQE